LEQNASSTSTGYNVIARDITIFMDAFDGEEGSVVPDAGDSWSLSTSNPPTLGYASQKYANSCLAGRADTNNDYYSTCDEPVEISGQGIHQWIQNWLALSHDLNHTSFMTALANTARTNSNSTWCDLCRLFAIHTPGNEASPQDLGRTTPIPITQYSDACLSSPVKDWIGPPPDPSLTTWTGSSTLGHTSVWCARLARPWGRIAAYVGPIRFHMASPASNALPAKSLSWMV